MKAVIRQKFDEYCQSKSDINEHLPTLAKYASECNHVTEMGVREVVSTWALLHGLQQGDVLRSFDIIKSDNIVSALDQAMSAGIDMKFTEADVLKIEIEETDMLFIDTLHTYTQLKKELELHAKKVRRFIVFHDVVTYGHTPEPAVFQTHKGPVSQAKPILENYVENDKGLIPAIEEFLEANPEWVVEIMFTNNNGLLIIKRNG